jgi:hypothetical protein
MEGFDVWLQGNGWKRNDDVGNYKQLAKQEQSLELKEKKTLVS